jgi:hypothetical protein
MKYIVLVIGVLSLFLNACDKVKNPFPPSEKIDLDTTIYTGTWSDYLANQWPTFTPNTNTLRNVLIEDFTGHKCTFCPAAAIVAHDLHNLNPNRVFVASIHAGPTGIGDFQSITLPDYPVDFTNSQGLEIGTYFGTNDGGFSGNPRGPISRITNGGNIFQSATTWTSLTNTVLTDNILKVNIQAKVNYYAANNGFYLHTEVEKLDPNLTNELAMVVYFIEDSIVGDQKMGDNSHNPAYVHKDLMRGCIDNRAFGRTLTDDMIQNGKYYLNYSYKIPAQYTDVTNLHLLIYVRDKVTQEIYQVIKQKIQ